jgi:hypothetical protein
MLWHNLPRPRVAEIHYLLNSLVEVPIKPTP